MRDKVTRHQIFYVPPGDCLAGLVTFTREESRHLLASLRLAIGDRITATDGLGSLLEVTISEVAGGRVTGTVSARTARAAPRPEIRLFQAAIKPPRMDLVVEKCVELGAAGLVVVDCERCQRRDSVARLERWRRVAVEAMKQSLQAHLPEIAWASALSGALAGAARLESSLVALGPGEHPRLGDVLAAGRPSSVGIWVGPEGGFSEEEIGLLAAAGAVPFRLSDSRLRSETAAIASVAAVRAVLG